MSSLAFYIDKIDMTKIDMTIMVLVWSLSTPHRNFKNSVRTGCGSSIPVLRGQGRKMVLCDFEGSLD